MKDMTVMDELDEIFDIRSANEWLRDAKEKPVPKMLFGDLWLEGELAILFADTGKGKSLLAAQIAESIAVGHPIDPLEMTAEPREVLYLDFELTGKQFEMRYAAEHDPDEGEFLANHYNFSEGFKRIEIRNVSSEQGRETFEARVRRMIEPLVLKTGARVLIIDNITYLKRTTDTGRESAPLMKELNRLKKELGLSILVLAHTPKRDVRRPITVNDPQGSKMIANFADGIFAIGQSKADPGVRYLKHIKGRDAELIYDASHLPTFRIARLKGNFLGFRFERFASEAKHLLDTSDTHQLQMIQRIKKMSDSDMPIRAIADAMNLSKSTAHRLLKMWQPSDGPRWSKDLYEEDEDDQYEKAFDGAEKCAFEMCTGCEYCLYRPGNRYHEINVDLWQHQNCPDTCEVCGPRSYLPDDTSADPVLRERSEQFFKELNDWLETGKQGERPAYPGAGRFDIPLDEESPARAK